MLIDGAVVRGASDAGIYVGQSQDIVVRNSVAEFNVAGIEIENSYRADVYDNVATRNTGGILVFDLPNIPQQGGHDIRIFRNRSVDNDTRNFAPEGNIVGLVPTGTGVLIMAGRNIEVFDNELAGNQTANLLIGTYPKEFDDDDYVPNPQAIHVYENRFGRGGWAPEGEMGEWVANITGTPVPDIVWDGVTPLWDFVTWVSDEDKIVLRDNVREDGSPATFMDLDGIWQVVFPYFADPSTELEDHQGTLPPVAPVKIKQEP